MTIVQFPIEDQKVRIIAHDRSNSLCLWPWCFWVEFLGNSVKPDLSLKHVRHTGSHSILAFHRRHSQGMHDRNELSILSQHPGSAPPEGHAVAVSTSEHRPPRILELHRLGPKH